MKMPDYPDNELVNMVCEDSEDARDILYKKYVGIVDYLVYKYRNIAKAIGIDSQELRQEAMVGFSHAIVSYNQNKETSLSTFISLCVERRIRNIVRNFDSQKTKLFKDTYSLDEPLTNDENTLTDFLGDSKTDPQVLMENEEERKRLINQAHDVLSPSEKDVFDLLINGFTYRDIESILQIDTKQLYNFISRIRSKLKKWM